MMLNSYVPMGQKFPFPRPSALVGVAAKIKQRPNGPTVHLIRDHQYSKTTEQPKHRAGLNQSESDSEE